MVQASKPNLLSKTNFHLMEMSEKDALSVIDQMIASAKREVKDNGFYFMLWGWLVFISAIIDYVLVTGLYKPWQDYHAVVWGIFMPLGGLISIIGGIREKKKAPQVKTYIDELMSYVLRAFGISIFIVCFFMPFTANWPAFYPVMLLVYAIWLYIAGGALRFKPLIYGGYANWLFSIGAFFCTYDKQLILLALAVLIGYIIPGHMLKSHYNKHVQGA
jgi:MFS family permease